MNRILFETDEVKGSVATIGDIRAEHILTVLRGEVGQELKVGVMDGKIGTGRITGIAGREVTVELELNGESLKPWFDLILAPPRPRVFKRLLPQLAALGMRKLTLIGARKVEKDFWGATILKEENYRPLFVEGLQQAGTSILPTIEIERSFRRFLAGCEAMDGLKLVAHPYGADGSGSGRRLDGRRSEGFRGEGIQALFAGRADPEIGHGDCGACRQIHVKENICSLPLWQ